MQIDKEEFLRQLHAFFLNEHLSTRDDKTGNMPWYATKMRKISSILNEFEGIRFPPKIERQRVSVDGKRIISMAD